MLNEKNKKYENLKIKNGVERKEIQNIIFTSSENMDKNEKNYSLETHQLKLLNFQMENEIKNTDFLITQKKQINSIKSNTTLKNENNEIYLNNNYINFLKVLYILKIYLKEKQIKFIDSVNEVSEKQRKIKSISYKISDLKYIIENNNNENINTVTDKSKNSKKSIIIIDDSIIINKNNIKEKEKIITSNKLINKNIFPEKSKANYYKALSPKIIINITNNINNCLNNKYNLNNVNCLNSNDDVNNKEYEENSLHSFNSSHDSNSLSRTINNKLMIEELELIEDIKIKNKLYLSDDNTNTENSINNSINENEKQNQEDIYIFTNMSDKE